MSSTTAEVSREIQSCMDQIVARLRSAASEVKSDRVSVFEMTVAAGHKIPAPAHKNDAYEETIYGIDGVVTWTVDAQPIEVGPGQALCIPRGAVHPCGVSSS